MAKGDKIPGGLTDNWSIEDVVEKHDDTLANIKKELKMGIEVELEHTKSKELAEEIALDHLHEFPDYYTRLKDMENKAEKDLNEGKENITAYAKRMRELAGYSEDENKKSIRTINEGVSDFDEGMTFYAKDMMAPKKEGKKPGDLDINGNIIPEIVNESEEKEEEFETHTFKQKAIEEGAEDEELYTLNEDTIIVLDFLNEGEDEKSEDPVKKSHNEYEKEKDEKKYGSDEWVKAQQDLEESSTSEVRHDSDRKGPTDSATWHDEGKEMEGNDGKMWKIVTGSNDVNRWVHV